MKPGVDVVEGFSQRNLILNRCYPIGAAVLFVKGGVKPDHAIMPKDDESSLVSLAHDC